MQVPVLFTLAEDLTKMQVIVSVDEADVGQVKENQKVSFSVDAYPQKVFKGTIKQLRMNSQIIDSVVTYEALVEVNNSDLLLRPGMTVSADITTKVIKDAKLIPNAALRFSPPQDKKQKYIFSARTKKKQERDKGTYIWILKENQARQIEVNTGESDGVNTVITGKNPDINSLVIIGLSGN